MNGPENHAKALIALIKNGFFSDQVEKRQPHERFPLSSLLDLL
jgi:hypothetical protein